MRLPFPFLHKNKKSPVCYLALLLTSEKVSAVIMEEIDGKIKILSEKYQLFKTAIEDIGLEELIETIDHTLSRALEILPPDIELRKTVFGVKENWVEAESKKIKKDYLQKLKKVCEALDLVPIGFIVITEAIANLMQQDEGAPLSAVLVELGGKLVTLTLLRGGRSIQMVEGAIEGSQVLTVNNLLNQFTAEVLPARIILYDTEISEMLVQQFIKHQWSKVLPFLHMPQISVLPGSFESRAIVFGAAGQMGLTVITSDEHGIKTYQNNKPMERADEMLDARHESKHADKEREDQDLIIPHETFGFIINGDIADKSKLDVHTSDEKEEIAENIDVPDEVEMKLMAKEKSSQEQRDLIEQEEMRSIIKPEAKKFNENSLEENQPGEKGHEMGKGPTILNKLHLPSIPAIPSLWFRGILVPLIILGVIVGGAYYFYFYKVTASVILTLKPKDVTKDMDVVFASDENNDFASNIIGAKEVNDTTDGEMSTATTGKKDVGDKAAGTVTLYNNNTDSDITLAKGTSLKSENGLTFLLSKDVTVASASGDVYSGTKPGTAKGDVTAEDIGTKYNLPSGTKFSIEGQASVAGKNDSAFSGGSSKTVTVVSKDDLSKLKNDLLKDLESKADEALVKRAKEDNGVIPLVLSKDIQSTKYDKNAGDEAKSVKLSATIAYTGLSYQIRDTKDYAKAILEEQYGKEKTFNDDSIKIELKNTEKKNEKQISAILAVVASLLPKIETSEIAKKISGRPRQEAATILSKYPQLAGTNIVYSPNISFLAGLFPVLPSHVEVRLASN